MDSAIIREMSHDDEYYVGACARLRETEEIDACAQRRMAWMKRMRPLGLEVTNAIVNGNLRGFLFLHLSINSNI